MPYGRVKHPLMSGLIIFAGVWAIIYAVFQSSLYKLSTKEIKQIQGCYFLNNKIMFKIDNQYFSFVGHRINYYGSHEKGRDVIVLSSPILIQSSGRDSSVYTGGNVTKLPIVRSSSQVFLELWTDDARRVLAKRDRC
jgi:hypothetical protein